MRQIMEKPDIIGLFYFGCGGPIRTVDLRVMSPTSFQLLHPAECVRVYNYLPCFAIFFKSSPGRSQITLKSFSICLTSSRGNPTIFVSDPESLFT